MQLKFLLLLLGQLLFAFLLPLNVMSAPSLSLMSRLFVSTVNQEANDMWNSVANAIPINKQYSELQASDHCESCKLAATTLRLMVRYGANEKMFGDVVESMCIRMKIMSKNICSGVVKAFRHEVYSVLKHSTKSSDQLCTLALGHICYQESTDWEEWEIKIPKPIDIGNQSRWFERDLPSKDSKRYLVVQISDTHVDHFYAPGTSANCGDPLCCRADMEPLANATNDYNKVGGHWGSYGHCDIPNHTYLSVLNDIKQRYGSEVDFVLWTGDVPAHDVWMQSEANQLNDIRWASEQITDWLNVSVLPTLGNHEGFPVNSFPEPDLNIPGTDMSWLYSNLKETWGKLLPKSFPTNDHIANGAFYSVMVRPGLKVISINTNYCNNGNFWLVLNPRDPVNQLKWLVSELLEAEQNDTAVFIIGHIPPGLIDCIPVWSRNYYRIVSRFAGTIRAQFFAHQHADKFELFYDYDQLMNNRQPSSDHSQSETMNPINVAYIGPSVTTFFGVNPGYRVYEIDQTTHELMNHYTYAMDLKLENDRFAQNNSSIPEFRLLYTPLDAYNMTSLRPQAWHELAKQFCDDIDLLNVYIHRTFAESSSDISHQAQCAANDTKCVRKNVCPMATGMSYDDQLCDQVLQCF